MILFGIVARDLDWKPNPPPPRILVALSAAEVAQMIPPRGRAVLGLEVDHLPGGEVRPVLTEALRRFSAVVLRVGTTPAAWARLMALHDLALHCRIAVQGIDDLPHALQAALRGDRPGTARGEILNSVAIMCAGKPELVPILAATICLGVGRATILDVARTCGLSAVTLNRRLKQAGVVSLAALLDLTRCMQAAYLLDDLGLSVDQAAVACGFGGRHGFEEFVKVHTGHTPAEIARSHAFDGLLASLPERLVAPAESRVRTDASSG